MSDIRILDACCGSKMFWFDKQEPHTTYMDRREEEFEIHKKKINVKPDIVADFRDMPFEDETFNLVVFDPPHLLWAGQKSFMRAQYGQLDLLTWRLDLLRTKFQSQMNNGHTVTFDTALLNPSHIVAITFEEIEDEEVIVNDQ